MNESEIIRDMTPEDLESQLIGKTIVAIDTDTNKITLNDGTILTLADASSCCAWFEASIRKGNLTDNAITAVEVTYDEEPEEFSSYSSWTIHVLAENKKICDIDICGDETSGYYCHSINLEIQAP